MKWKVTCPKCNHMFKTAAKRPQCKCGHAFSRTYVKTLIDNAKTKPCKCCGREIPYQGAGMPRRYCECCFPQIQALKRFFAAQRYKKKHPDRFKKWYQDTREIVVAATCIFCDDLILGNRAKKVCHDCLLKWGHKTPRSVKDALIMHPSFTPLEHDLLVWSRIVNYRARGIYNLKLI